MVLTLLTYITYLTYNIYIYIDFRPEEIPRRPQSGVKRCYILLYVVAILVWTDECEGGCVGGDDRPRGPGGRRQCVPRDLYI